ncbi:hypothetical protein AK830_g3362 [Neonectria ditissima]|uniref:Mid2 domain-containing protein n=1 Tax=Neonectria ditissima TaxID=78410 RepID=A0A0P7BP94_9HYPO|nr:hypothetical protein AK830_g3362 [Neonectria ditissima]
MHSLTLFVVGLVAFIAGVRADSSFVTPPNGGPANNYQDNPSYDLGETINVEWTSDLSSIDIVIWQQYPTSPSSSNMVYLIDHTTATSVKWKVSLKGLLSNVTEGEQAILYLAMYQTGQTNFDATCHYFNVTIPASLTSSATTATSTIDATTTSHISLASITSTSATAESTSDSDSNSDSDSGLGKGAVAGVAVGASLGGLLFLGGLAFLAWRHLRKMDSSGAYMQSQQSPSQEPKHELAPGGWNHAPQAQGPPGLYEAP